MKDPNPSIFRMQHTQLLAYSREKNTYYVMQEGLFEEHEKA